LVSMIQRKWTISIPIAMAKRGSSSWWRIHCQFRR
jgi:hypothetical protein